MSQYLKRLNFRILLKRFTIWRYRKMSQRQFLLIASISVGLLGGLLAVLLKNITHFFQWAVQAMLIERYGWEAFYFAFPLLGIFLTLLVIKYFLKSSVGHGIPEVMRSISKNGARLPFKSIYSYLVTAPLTVGLGGSAGLEGPSVSMGAALGSNFAKSLHLDNKLRQMLLACASAAALSAVFKVPITGIIFVIEVFALELTTASLIPLMLSSASGLVVSYLFLGDGLTLDLAKKGTFNLSSIHYYLILALLCSVVSIHFIKLYSRVGKFLSKRIKKSSSKLLICAGSLGIILFFFPSVYGEGYGVINTMLNDSFQVKDNFHLPFEIGDSLVIILLAVMIYVKMLATTLTFSAGGVGGTFAPVLFIGSSLGFLFAKTVNMIKISGGYQELISVSNFSLVAMAGVMSAVMKAPLTAVFLIAEITGGYYLIAPLMLVSAISFVFSKVFIKHSIYTEELLKNGESLTLDKDKKIIENINLEKIIEKDFVTIGIEDTLGKITKEAIEVSNRNIFPVVDKKGKLLGVILLDDLRTIMFDKKLYDSKICKTLMIFPSQVIYIEKDNINSIMNKFQSSNLWNIPIVNKDDVYLGFISKSKLLNVYRQKMLSFNTESLK